MSRASWLWGSMLSTALVERVNHFGFKQEEGETSTILLQL